MLGLFGGGGDVDDDVSAMEMWGVTVCGVG